MADFVLELRDISKEFPGVKALSRVSLQIHRNDIHVICGENGAGKSTLMKILSGVYPHGSYGGQFFIDGQPQEYRHIKDSERAGIVIIYQELALVHSLNVCENLFLGNEFVKKAGIIDWFSQYTKAKEALSMVGLDVSPSTPVRKLGIGQQQLLEIAKALTKDVKILLLDEPTAALNDVESQNLLNIMRNLQEKGITCVFISHKLEEVLAVANAITVIRDGASIVGRLENRSEARIDEDELIRHMVGRSIDKRYPKTECHHPEEVILEVKDWSVAHPDIPGRKLLDSISFCLHKREILGIAGLMGAGRTELAQSLIGALKGKERGIIRLQGIELNIRKPKDAIAAGIAYVTEDRKGLGFIADMSILKNTILASLKRLSNKYGVIDQLRAIKEAAEYCQKMDVKTPSLEQKIKNLSGGNQQKAILAKWLMSRPKLLILDEPTRGIDVGAKYDIYQLMNELIAEGVGIIMISSELPEILGMSDRILIISSGKVAGYLPRAEATQENIMALATRF